MTSKEIGFYNHYNRVSDSIYTTNTSLAVRNIEISKKYLNNFRKFKIIFLFKNLPNSTIYRLTEKFINGLQNDYPTTVATIFRTSDKLTPSEDLFSDGVEYCILCEVKISQSNYIKL